MELSLTGYTNFIRIDDDVDCRGETEEEMGEFDKEFGPQRLEHQRSINHHLDIESLLVALYPGLD